MNKTLNNLIVIFKINIASKFNINLIPISYFKGNIFIVNKLFLQF
jgi:hypothetical protein